MTDISYNGICGRELGIFVAHRPDIPVPQSRYSATVIPGRDGSVIHKDGAYKDISIKVELHFAADRHAWHATADALRRWLLTQTDPKLILSDDQQWFYKVKSVKVDDISRELARIGKATAVFLCDPYKYHVQGSIPRPQSLCRVNNWDTCHPVYCVQSSGRCQVNVGLFVDYTGTIYLDSDLMIAYDEDGNNLNACVTGDYENLWLHHGRNTVSCVGYGKIDHIVPNWRTL